MPRSCATSGIVPTFTGLWFPSTSNVVDTDVAPVAEAVTVIVVVPPALPVLTVSVPLATDAEATAAFDDVAE